jgi:hypothetical protein
VEETIEREHFYHAEATALSGHLRLPLEREIRQPALVKLPERGGYLTERAGEFRLGSVITYKSAYTHAAGNREIKPGHGWSTLTSAVVEGLNVLDVVTADRVVAQVSIEHPLEGYVPSVTFLGTRFENLRIAGHEVKLDLDLDLCGGKPDHDAPYTKSPGFLSRVAEQHGRLREIYGRTQNPLAELLERYNLVPESFENSSGAEEIVECSLVNQAEGSYPGHSIGHVIHVPHFGTIYLAVLKLRHCDFKPDTRIPEKTIVELTMIDMQLGCVGTGGVQTGGIIAGGHTKP